MPCSTVVERIRTNCIIVCHVFSSHRSGRRNFRRPAFVPLYIWTTIFGFPENRFQAAPPKKGSGSLYIRKNWKYGYAQVRDTIQTSGRLASYTVCRHVPPYIFCRLLTVLSVESRLGVFGKTGLEKTARGQIPNPHPQVHPPQSFYFCYTVEYELFIRFTFV